MIIAQVQICKITLKFFILIFFFLIKNSVINELFLNFSYILQYCLIDIEDVGYIDLKGLTLDLDFAILKNSSGLELDLNSLIIDYHSMSLNLGECLDKQILAFLTKSTINLIWPLIKTSISNSFKTVINEVFLNYYLIIFQI